MRQSHVILKASGCGSQINTAYVERNNLTMRQNVGRLVHKTHSFSKNVHYLQRHIALEDAVYNFVKPHGVLEAEAEKLAGFENLISVTGIGARSAGVLLSVIGEVEDFADENKLASYFGATQRGSGRGRHRR